MIASLLLAVALGSPTDLPEPSLRIPAAFFPDGTFHLTDRRKVGAENVAVLLYSSTLAYVEVESGLQFESLALRGLIGIDGIGAITGQSPIGVHVEPGNPYGVNGGLGAPSATPQKMPAVVPSTPCGSTPWLETGHTWNLGYLCTGSGSGVVTPVSTWSTLAGPCAKVTYVAPVPPEVTGHHHLDCSNQGKSCTFVGGGIQIPLNCH